MSDKASLSNVELELTQKIQLHFPRGIISPEAMKFWNGCTEEVLSAKLAETFSEIPESVSLNPLLEFLGTATLPARTEQFVAREKFVQDTSRGAKVKISGTGSNFGEWFLGKTEEPTGETTLRYAKLLRSEVDAPIRAEIGTELEESKLSHIFALMELQPRGQSGALLTDGRANIFYVKDAKGVLRAVGVDCHGDGWVVYAHSVDGPGRWYDGLRVFSRNS